MPNKHREITQTPLPNSIKSSPSLANDFHLQFSASENSLKATTTRCVVIVERTFVVEIASNTTTTRVRGRKRSPWTTCWWWKTTRRRWPTRRRTRRRRRRGRGWRGMWGGVLGQTLLEVSFFFKLYSEGKSFLMSCFRFKGKGRRSCLSLHTQTSAARVKIERLYQVALIMMWQFSVFSQSQYIW